MCFFTYYNISLLFLYMILVNTGFRIHVYYKYGLYQTKLHSPVVPVTTEFNCILVLRAINEILTNTDHFLMNCIKVCYGIINHIPQICINSMRIVGQEVYREKYLL